MRRRAQRSVITVFFLICVGFCLLAKGPSVGATLRTEALSLWKGDVKEQLVDYIFDVSTEGSPDFIPAGERVAVFDMDGTLLSEKPNYFVFDVAAHYLNERADEICSRGPAQAALCDAAKRHDYDYFMKHIADAFALPFEGTTYAFYRDYCLHVFETAVNPVKNRLQKDLIFRPMIQLIDLLQERDFEVYVVSASLQFCVMAISEKYLHVKKANCIGSMVEAIPEKEGNKTVFKRGKLLPPPNLQEAKAMRIMMRTGQAPVLAVGNSGGDAWMLGFTATSPHRTFTGIVDHDDPREFEYRKEKLLKLAEKEEWTIISIKDNFKTVYGE